MRKVLACSVGAVRRPESCETVDLMSYFPQEACQAFQVR